MMNNRHSLILRISLSFALLLVLIFGALSIFLSSFVENTYLDILRSNLQSETALAADRLSVLMQSTPDAAAIDERVKRYASVLGVRVTVIDPNGVVIGESATAANEMENHLNRPEIQRALKGQTSTETRYSDTLQTQMLYAAAPMYDGSRLLGVTRMAISLRVIQRNVSNLMRTIFIAAGIATLLAVLLGILLAWYTVHPLKRLTETAQRIADGQLEEIASTPRRDEIGTLQLSIQQMAHHLKAQIADLRTERSKLEAVLNNMTDGVIIVDTQGNVQLINPAAVRLFNLDEKDPLRYRSLIEVVRHHQLVDIWNRCQRTGLQQATTLETSPDRLFIQGIATPLKDSLPGMTLLVFQDLTRVRKLETVRRDFVSNVSHELRTPLASLKALTETLQEGALEDPPAARRFLLRMETEIDNLTQMVHELLELSRIESNKVPLQRIPVSPCDLATPAVERMQLQAERAGLKLHMDCSDSLPMVNADADRIEQVMVNLIHNSIKFTQPGGEIQVSIHWENQTQQVIFAIRDTGIGINPEVLPRIFERFYKADRARSGGGTGLGLSIARHLVEAHGGRIWAESDGLHGSTFYFSLPTAVQ